MPRFQPICPLLIAFATVAPVLARSCPDGVQSAQGEHKEVRAVPAQGDAAQDWAPKPGEKVVSARIWFVSFDMGIDPDKLPVNPRALFDPFRAIDEKGRIETTGLAGSIDIEKFEVAAGGYRLLVRGDDLVTEAMKAAAKTGDDSDKSAPPWQIISAPRIMTYVGQDASIEVGKPISYLEPREDGALVLRRFGPDKGMAEGISLTLRATRADDKGVRFEDIKIKITRVIGRQPIKDIPFDVGMPIIDTRETQLNDTVERGHVAVIPLPQGQKEPPILVFIMATIVANP